MKYVGSVIILNEDGIPVYERELTADELVEELLKEPVEIVGIPETQGITKISATPPTARQQKTVGGGPAEKVKRQTNCKTCGKPGHMAKTCPETRRVQGDPDHTPDTSTTKTPPIETFNRETNGPMSAITFLDVKDLQAKGKPSMLIASARHLNIKEVGWAMNSETYSEYQEKRKV